MVRKYTFTLGRQGGHAEVGRAGGRVCSDMTLLVGSRGAASLGRFLLSSTGVHVILAWAIIGFGLPKVSTTPKPLVVTIIEGDSSGSSASSSRPDSTHTRQPVARGPATAPANSKATAQPVVSPPSPAPAASLPVRAAEAVEPRKSDEQSAEPKTVGLSAGGSHAAAVALAASGLSSGPILLSPDGGGGVGSDSAGRGGAGRLDAALVAPLTPSVTIGSAQGGGGGGAGGTGKRATGGGFAAPNYGINPLPKYPLVAREKGYEGTVYLRVLVRTDGRVEQLTVDRSSGYEILDRAAADAVKEWAFFPAKKAGKPVESWVLLPVKFALN